MVRRRKTGKPGPKSQALIDGLIKKGWSQIESTSGKYKTFSHPDKDTRVFVGRSAGLRAGLVVSKSRSIGHTTFAKGLLE